MMTYATSTPYQPPFMAAAMTMLDNPQRDKDGILDSRVTGQFLKDKIDAKGWAYIKFADMLGINPTYLSALLAGRNNAAKSMHFKQIIALLNLTREEVEYINPNIVIVHPDAERFEQVVAPVSLNERPLPTPLLKAMDTLKAMGHEWSEDTVRSVLPRGLDGRGPQTETEWLEFLIAVKKWL